MALSILHRGTGIALSVGLLMMTWFLAALASGPSSYEYFMHFAGSPLGTFMLMGWSFALCLHFCSGIRHLFFDTGSLFDIRHSLAAGYAVIGGAFVLTALLWLCVFGS